MNFTKIFEDLAKKPEGVNVAQATQAIYAQAFQDVVSKLSAAMQGPANVVASLRANAATINSMADLIEAAMEDEEEDDKEKKKEEKTGEEKEKGKEKE